MAMAPVTVPPPPMTRKKDESHTRRSGNSSQPTESVKLHKSTMTDVETAAYR